MDIKGYRALSSQELGLINQIKLLAESVEACVQQLREVRDFQLSGDPLVADQRWVSIGATELQQGFMALVRAVAKPTSF